VRRRDDDPVEFDARQHFAIVFEGMRDREGRLDFGKLSPTQTIDGHDFTIRVGARAGK